jgi:hypothetical protein
MKRAFNAFCLFAVVSIALSTTMYPESVRSLTLTDCDTHDNWPPEAFKPFLAMAAAGGSRGTLEAMLSDKSVYRSPQALGPATALFAMLSPRDLMTRHSFYRRVKLSHPSPQF